MTLTRTNAHAQPRAHTNAQTHVDARNTNMNAHVHANNRKHVRTETQAHTSFHVLATKHETCDEMREMTADVLTIFEVPLICSSGIQPCNFARGTVLSLIHGTSQKSQRCETMSHKSDVRSGALMFRQESATPNVSAYPAPCRTG